MREVLIGLDFVQIYVLFQFTILFLFQTVQHKRARTSNLGWSLFYLVWGCMILLNVFRVFYLDPDDALELFNAIMILGMIGSVIIVNLLERILQYYVKTKYAFSIFGYVFSVVIAFLTIEQKQLAFLVWGPIILIFTALFFKKILRDTVGQLRTYFLLLIFSFYFVLFGFGLITPRFEKLSEIAHISLAEQYLISRIITLVAFQIMAIVCLKFPVFEELEWRRHLKELYVIKTLESVPIAYHDFTKTHAQDTRVTKELVAGGMVGISQILGEISRAKKKLQLIDHGDLSLCIEHGEYVFLVAIADDDFYAVREKMRRLIEDFEDEFGDTLQDWDGNVDTFEKIKGMIKERFA